ncbi:MAG: DUF1570 domain-containing protein [bacterium]|nr:DUF1570 domain-containing protein [bacterium]
MRLLVLATLTLFASAPAALGQAFIKEKHPELGVPSFSRPRTFEAIPTRPGEPFVKLVYTEKLPDPKKRGAEPRLFRPEIKVLVIDRPKVESGPKDADEKAGPQVTSVTTYAKHRMLGGWETEHLGDGKRSRGFVTSRFQLRPPRKVRRQYPLLGYAYSWESPARIVCVLGLCHENDWDELAKLFEDVGDKIKVADPADSGLETKKLERYYRQKRLSHPEYRIGVRKALVDDWVAEDTDNYIVVHHTKDQPLLRKVLRDLELLREEYMRRFPPKADFDAVSTVRICANRDEYIAYGGHPRTAGHWSPSAEELVLYDAEKAARGQRPDDGDTFITLYHEAFHQYIHYSAGELAPHSWFNEGYGDFFSGATIKNGKVRKIDVNHWRLRRVKTVVGARQHVPWEKIIHWSQARYYQNGPANYAQGWSMVYFLNTAAVVREREDWAGILPRYFEALKERFALEVAKQGGPTEDAEEAARIAANDAAFEGIDLVELEAAWVEFVDGL